MHHEDPKRDDKIADTLAQVSAVMERANKDMPTDDMIFVSFVILESIVQPVYACANDIERALVLQSVKKSE